MGVSALTLLYGLADRYYPVNRTQTIMRKGEAAEAWENEGGAKTPHVSISPVPLKGTASQVEWAERIRMNVNREFDRVVSSFQGVAARQRSGRHAEIMEIIALVEEKRADVLKRDQAGYFIHDWQDISDQVRRMIFDDARYTAIRARLAARTNTTASTG